MSVVVAANRSPPPSVQLIDNGTDDRNRVRMIEIVLVVGISQLLIILIDPKIESTLDAPPDQTFMQTAGGGASPSVGKRAEMVDIHDRGFRAFGSSAGKYTESRLRWSFCHAARRVALSRRFANNMFSYIA
jgi:hypothetical protein